MTEDSTVSLIKAVVANMQGAEDDWVTLSMVVEFRERRIATTYGYAYNSTNEAYAVAARPSRIMEAFDQFVENTYGPDEPAPVKLLIQFNRDSGQYTVQYEDTDRLRWKVTPNNIDTIINELRPNF